MKELKLKIHCSHDLSGYSLIFFPRTTNLNPKTKNRGRQVSIYLFNLKYLFNPNLSGVFMGSFWGWGEDKITLSV